FKTADLQREAGAVDQQADDDLRINAALFRVADFAQVVFRFGFEVQRRHVIEQQAQPAAVGSVSKAFAGDRVSIATGADQPEVTLNRCRTSLLPPDHREL